MPPQGVVDLQAQAAQLGRRGFVALTVCFCRSDAASEELA
jgi:hypothetical protein